MFKKEKQLTYFCLANVFCWYWYTGPSLVCVCVYQNIPSLCCEFHDELFMCRLFNIHKMNQSFVHYVLDENLLCMMFLIKKNAIFIGDRYIWQNMFNIIRHYI